MSNIDDVYYKLKNIDNKISIRNQEINLLKQKRLKYENYLINQINLNHNKYELTKSNEILTLGIVKKKEGLSQKLLKKSIHNYYLSKYNDENKCKKETNNLLNFILDNRKQEISNTLKVKKKKKHKD